MNYFYDWCEKALDKKEFIDDTYSSLIDVKYDSIVSPLVFKDIVVGSKEAEGVSSVLQELVKTGDFAVDDDENHVNLAGSVFTSFGANFSTQKGSAPSFVLLSPYFQILEESPRWKNYKLYVERGREKECFDIPAIRYDHVMVSRSDRAFSHNLSTGTIYRLYETLLVKANDILGVYDLDKMIYGKNVLV